ncbi:MAG: CD225/dispanin family protein [Paramuribaculum sp.]|nr:CD225/dispanin family protein [Paramuribaculum sp.]
METTDYKYWIIQDGLRKGPFSYSELRSLAVDGTTPVWREGLANWIAIRDLDEFRDDYRPVIPPPPVPGLNPPAREIRHFDEAPAFRQYDSAPSSSGGDMPPMPRTYLVWNILALILCCLVTGIVGLVYSSKVSTRYASGDYQGAVKASETACLWLIISIVCGLVALPFQVIFAFL